MLLDRILDNVLPPPTYKFPPYDRLKPWQIRVLSLHKNSRGPRISGNLKTIDLVDHVHVDDSSVDGEAREAPPYHAVSYAPGDLNNKVRFDCDGRIFFIGFNLWQALVRLADLDLPCPIWVDALCINQRDGKEKTRQIQQMAQVYKQAQRVWIWLGEARQCTLQAITGMPTLVKVLSGHDSWSASHHDYNHYFDDENMPKPKLTVWDGISDLINRPYFGRLWVLQEAVLARRRTFLCGPHPFRWNDFQQLTFHLERQRLRSFILSFRRAPCIDAFDFFSDVDVCDLSALGSYRDLDRLRDILMIRSCSGSRDKVMAVLGLLSADQQQQVKADAPLPKQYATFTSLVLTCDIALSTFILAGAYRGHHGLPSWCPDYHVARKVVPLSDISRKSQRNVPKTSASSSIINAPGKMWFQIEVIGYRVDTINSVARGEWPRRVRTNGILDPNEAERALDWEWECSKLLEKVYGRSSTEGQRVYARTLIGNARVFKVPKEPHLRELFGFRVIRTPEESSTDPAVHYGYLRPALAKMEHPPTDSEGRKVKPPGAKRYMADVSRMCTGRAFFRTERDRIRFGSSRHSSQGYNMLPRRRNCSLHSSPESDFQTTRTSTCISSPW
jgi:hypothetical protein